MRIQDFGMTVKMLLDIDLAGQLELLAGKDGQERLVTSVSRLDEQSRLPAVAKGELFLTEGVSWQDERKLQDTLRQANDAGAAGIALQPAAKTPSAAVLETANQLALPLLRLKNGVQPGDIANLVLKRVLDSQAQVLEKIQELNRALTSTMLHGGNLQEISRILYQRFGNSVAISSDFLSSYVLNTTTEKRTVISSFLEDEKRRALTGRQTAVKTVTRQTDDLNGTRCDRITVPIYSDSMMHGRIYMWEDFRPISGVEQSVLESATSLIALDMMKKMSVLNMENSNRGGFLAGLLSGEQKQLQNALSNAKYFDFNSKAGHRVMVIRLRRRTGPRKDTLYQFNTYIIRVLQQLVRNTAVKIIYANQGNQIILLLESTPAGGKNLAHTIDEFIQLLYSRFSQEGIAGLLVMGVGREYHDVAELHKSLSEAKQALSCPLPQQNGSVWFERTGIYRLLCNDCIRDEAELFCDEMLRPLLDYDGDKDARLLYTLEQYFACSGNLTKVAERMEVHYNTVCNRLQKIQDLAGIRLDDPIVSMNLQAALCVYAIYADDDLDER